MKLLLLALPLLMFGCVTATPREPAQVVIETSAKKEKIMSALIDALTSNNYVIKTVSPELGILTTEPKGINLERGVLHIVWPARVTVQAVVVSNAVRLTFSEECGTGDARFGTGNWQHCNAQDSEASGPLDKEGSVVSRAVREALGKIGK